MTENWEAAGGKASMIKVGGGDFEDPIISVLKVGHAGKDAGKKKEEATSS